MTRLILLLGICCASYAQQNNADNSAVGSVDDDPPSSQLFSVDGKVTIPDSMADSCSSLVSYYFFSCVIMTRLILLLGICCAAHAQQNNADNSAVGSVDDEPPSSKLFSVDGKVTIPDNIADDHWQRDTKILLNYAAYAGFVQKDGSFRVSVPSGSYIMEVANRDFIFEPIRVDVSSRGKVRARRLQLLQPSAVNTLAYPVRFKPKSAAKYFQARETWRVTDFLFSPMVMMMILPLILIMVLPKLIDTSDPQIQRDMQQTLQMPKYELPELSEVMASWFGGGKKPKPKSKKK